MRRVAAESLLLGALVGALAAAWFAPEASAVCGSEGAAFAWRLGQLDAWRAGTAPLAGDHGAAVPVAGLPYVAFGAVLEPLLGLTGAWLASIALAIGGGAAALWGLTRAAGAGPVSAALAVIVGALPPVVARHLADGGVDLAVVPFAALALALLPRKESAARVVGFVAALLCGACDARTGAIVGLAAAAAGGGGWALLAAILATGTQAAAPAVGALDPVDLPAPFVALRADAVAPGLAALAGALWGVEEGRLRRGALVGFVCALGPVLAAFGDTLTVGDAAVPLPAALVAAFTPGGQGWTGGLVVAAVATALGLGRLAKPRLALLLAPLAVVEAARVAGPAPTCLVVDAPVAVRALGERQGGVLNLPVRAEAGEKRLGGPPGAHALYLAQQPLHGRALATGPAPLGATDPLYGEPAVVLSLGADRLLLPPTRPGEVLRGLGVTEIVVHRRLFPPGALALVDPVLFKLYGAPQRDHAGEVDLYRVDATGPVRAPVAESLHGIDDPAPAGWLDLGAYIAGLSPAAPVAPAGAGAGAADPEGEAAPAPSDAQIGRPAAEGAPAEAGGRPRGPGRAAQPGGGREAGEGRGRRSVRGSTGG